MSEGARDRAAPPRPVPRRSPPARPRSRPCSRVVERTARRSGSATLRRARHCGANWHRDVPGQWIGLRHRWTSGRRAVAHTARVATEVHGDDDRHAVQAARGGSGRGMVGTHTRMGRERLEHAVAVRIESDRVAWPLERDARSGAQAEGTARARRPTVRRRPPSHRDRGPRRCAPADQTRHRLARVGVARA